ncbi:hypothetical protein CDD80_3308 [Ophiocordyceps camponoti-rufipedis]|uniref:Threonylcarbamoyl-AMP synthase n=1 Tax=Ophiocordyceps camponoti-rufipedis TaxID=2004952 RepID=A0A2C5YZB1_9HYPO|nr:hypothetical protein CDD80_3308 [Ophiocordyceps camponoti-rufipedis]
MPRYSTKYLAVCLCLLVVSVVGTDWPKLVPRRPPPEDGARSSEPASAPRTLYIVSRREPGVVVTNGIPADISIFTQRRLEFESYQVQPHNSHAIIVAHENIISAVSCFLQRWTRARLKRITQFYIYEIERDDAISCPCPVLGRGNNLMYDGYLVHDPWLRRDDQRLIRWAPLPLGMRRTAWMFTEALLPHMQWHDENPSRLPQEPLSVAAGPYRSEPQDCVLGQYAGFTGMLSQEDIDEILGELDQDDEPGAMVTEEDMAGTNEDPECDAAQAQAAQQQLSHLTNTDLDLLFDDAEDVLQALLSQEQFDQRDCSSAMSLFRGPYKRSTLSTGNCCQLLALVRERVRSHACSHFSQLRFGLKLASNSLAGGTYDDIMLAIGFGTMTLAEHPSKYFDEEIPVDLEAAFGSSVVAVQDIRHFAVFSVPGQRSIADEWIIESLSLTGLCAGSHRLAQVRIDVNEGFSRWGDDGDKTHYNGRIDINDWRWLSPDAETLTVAVQPPGQPHACTHLESLQVRLMLGSWWGQGTWDKIYMDMGPGFLPGSGRLLLATEPSAGFDETIEVNLKQAFGSETVAISRILPDPTLIRLYSALSRDDRKSDEPDGWRLSGFSLRGKCAVAHRLLTTPAAMETRILAVPPARALGRFRPGTGLSRLEEWQMTTEAGSADELKTAAAHLRSESSSPVVAFPTETVYGLGADATRSAAVAAIYRAKGRPSDNPLIVHVADLTMLRRLLGPDGLLPSVYRPLVERFWPGPLTILLPCPEPSPLAAEVTAGLSTFGVRMPASSLALSLIKLADVPVAAPSANASTRPSPTTAQHVMDDLGGRIELILDGGPCRVGVESTVVDGLCCPPAVLRPGGVAIEDLRRCPGWASVVKAYEDHGEEGKAATPRAPGMKYKHYSPKASVVLYETSNREAGAGIPPADVDSVCIAADDARHGDAARIVGVVRTKRWRPGAGLCCAGLQRVSPLEPPLEQSDSMYHVLVGSLRDRDGAHIGLIYDLDLGTDTGRIARGLFSALRELDGRGADTIFVDGIDGELDIAAAVMNRLRKAASETRA